MRPRSGAAVRPLVVPTAAAIFLVALFLAAPIGSAQIDPGVRVTASTGRLEAGPGDDVPVDWSITNTGQLGGAVTIEVSAPDGWRQAMPNTPSSFRLESGQSQRISATIEPLAGQGTPADGEWTLRAVLADDLGRETSDSESVTVAFLAPPAPAPPPPPPDRTLEYMMGGLGGLAVLLLAALYVWQMFGIEVEADRRHREVVLGDHALAQVRVTNRRRWERNIQLRLSGLPSKWGGAFNTRSVLLERDETAQLPMFLRLPFDDMPDVDRHIRLQARPNRLSPWRTVETLVVRTADARAPMLVRTIPRADAGMRVAEAKIVPAP